MNKQDLINNLEKIKLIIGNGFDLYCGMKTKYSDFFKNNISKIDFDNWVNDFSFSTVRNYVNFKNDIINRKELWTNINDFDSTSSWDLLFYFASKKDSTSDEWNWCDVEAKMFEWLNPIDSGNSKNTKFNFEYVFRILNNEIYPNNLDIGNYYLAAFIYKKNGEKTFSTLNDFCFFLLSELNKFEKKFGDYIFKLQIDNSSFGSYHLNKNFNASKEVEILEKLGNFTAFSSVDSFNFSDVYYGDINKKIYVNHINGDCSNPIFGIDSKDILPNDPRYIFTKTYRRMNLDSRQVGVFKYETFSNVIIFGSSLGKADYNYFFSVLDKLNINDFSNDSKVVFAFHIYDKQKEDEIRIIMLKAVFDLFYEYSIYKGNNIQPNRLLDSLTAQRKVLFYEI